MKNRIFLLKTQFKHPFSRNSQFHLVLCNVITAGGELCDQTTRPGKGRGEGHSTGSDEPPSPARVGGAAHLRPGIQTLLFLPPVFQGDATLEVRAREDSAAARRSSPHPCDLMRSDRPPSPRETSQSRQQGGNRESEDRP